MTHSRSIAGFVGPLLAALGIAMLVNRDLFPSLVAEIARDQGLIFLSGILSLLAGIAIVRVHNVWSGGWRIVLTVMGYLAILGGLLRMWRPQFAGPIAEAFAGNSTGFAIGGVVVAALGAYLTYKAYGPADPTD